jgi:integrase
MPPKRRAYGSGSLTGPDARGLWHASIEAGMTATGTRRRIKKAGTDKQTVARWLRDTQRQILAEGVPVAGLSTRATVAQWAAEWLKITERKARPKTWATNAGAVRKWIIPTIGHRRLEELTPADLRAVADAQRREGLAPSSVLRTHAVAAVMLKAAYQEGHRINGRVLAMERPSKNEPDRGAIPLIDALALLTAAGRSYGGSRWLAALLQGTRQAETLGLTWDRVDLEHGLADISWQLQALPWADRAAGKLRLPDGFEHRRIHGAMCLTRPKTEKGQRIIPLIPPMVTALRAWRDECPDSPSGLIWPRLDGTPQTAKGDGAAWIDLQDLAQVARVDGTEGRRYGIHELRHTTATMLRRVGASDETIKAIMGHSSMASSAAYLHADQTGTRATLAAVGDALGL